MERHTVVQLENSEPMLDVVGREVDVERFGEVGEESMRVGLFARSVVLELGSIE